MEADVAGEIQHVADDRRHDEGAGVGVLDAAEARIRLPAADEGAGLPSEFAGQDRTVAP
jgi:hypothetical protein